MKKAMFVVPLAVAAVSVALAQTNGGHAKKSHLEGTWELTSGQSLPQGARDIKIIFVAYDSTSGKPLYTGGGTCTLNGDSYREHMDFVSDEIGAGLIGKDESVC